MSRPGRPAAGPWEAVLRSPEETERLGQKLGAALAGGDVLALYGELGTGKTTLVRGIARGLGAARASVTSPTFVLIHEYHGHLRLAHADLYRLSTPLELQDIGLWDYLDEDTAVAIEWAEKAGDELPPDRLELRLEHVDLSARRVSITALGGRSEALLGRFASTAVAG